MEEKYFIKAGYTENGEIAVAFVRSQSKPKGAFFYEIKKEYKPVLNPVVIELTQGLLEKLIEENIK